MSISYRAATAALIPLAAGIVVGCAAARQNDAQTSVSANTHSDVLKTAPAKPNSGVRMAQNLPSSTLASGSSPIQRSEEIPAAVVTRSGMSVPKGFQVNIFADGLTNPRRIVVAPGGTPQKYDLFVSESRANQVRVLRESNGDGIADEKFVYTTTLDQPYGLAFHPSGYLYIGNTANIIRLPYHNGDISTDATPEKIADLTRGGYNQHWTRNLLFSEDGTKLYATVGSSCNTCEETDSQRAAISVMNPDGSDRRLFSSGLRNPVGLAWRPRTKELWTVVNERDNLGDNVPPDYLTYVADGSFHGWPYAYTTIEGKVTPDPSFGDKKPEMVQKTVPPTVPVQAHSAALGVAFYPAKHPSFPKNGAHYFPAQYSGDAFLAFHGSWNRTTKTGYKIVRVDFQNNRPVSVTDFTRGFVGSDGSVSGRPVDVTIAPDGSLLFSDDDGGKIWRVSYSGTNGK